MHRQERLKLMIQFSNALRNQQKFHHLLDFTFDADWLFPPFSITSACFYFIALDFIRKTRWGGRKFYAKWIFLQIAKSWSKNISNNMIRKSLKKNFLPKAIKKTEEEWFRGVENANSSSEKHNNSFYLSAQRHFTFL